MKSSGRDCKDMQKYHLGLLLLLFVLFVVIRNENMRIVDKQEEW